MTRVEVLLVGFVALIAGRAAAGAATLPACQQAIDRYDAEFGDRSDDAALAATRALETTCAKPEVDRARAVSRRAVVLYQRHDLDAAIAGFAEAVRLNAEDATLRMSLCGVYTEAKRYGEAIETCQVGLTLAKAQDDGTPKRHAKVVDLGFNLALAKVRRRSNSCSDPTVFQMFDAYREMNPQHAWVYQLLGAWVWDCDDDFDKGFALYKKSCALGQQAACDQVAYTESCRCETRQADSP